ANVDLLAGFDASTRERLRAQTRDLQLQLTAAQATYDALPAFDAKPSAERISQQQEAGQRIVDAPEAVHQHQVHMLSANPRYRELLAADAPTASLADVQTQLIGPDDLLISYQIVGTKPQVVCVQKDKIAVTSLTVDEAHAKTLGIKAGPLNEPALVAALL